MNSCVSFSSWPIHFSAISRRIYLGGFFIYCNKSQQSWTGSFSVVPWIPPLESCSDLGRGRRNYRRSLPSKVETLIQMDSNIKGNCNNNKGSGSLSWWTIKIAMSNWIFIENRLHTIHQIILSSSVSHFLSTNLIICVSGKTQDLFYSHEDIYRYQDEGTTSNIGSNHRSCLMK